jgi:hypothetical protein
MFTSPYFDTVIISINNDDIRTHQSKVKETNLIEESTRIARYILLYFSWLVGSSHCTVQRHTYETKGSKSSILERASIDHGL